MALRDKVGFGWIGGFCFLPTTTSPLVHNPTSELVRFLIRADETPRTTQCPAYVIIKTQH